MVVKSMVLRRPINEYRERKDVTKKELAVDMKVSQQSITDWTNEDHPKPMTAERFVQLIQVSKDATLAGMGNYIFMSMLPSMSGGEFRLDFNSLNSLRSIEAGERDKVFNDPVLRRMFDRMNQSEKEKYRDVIISAAKEQAEVVMVNTQLLNTLCEAAEITVPDLVNMYSDFWQSEGYFKVD